MYLSKRSPRRTWPLGLTPALALLLAGCASLPFGARNQAPDYAPTNVRGPAEWPPLVRRVALLPTHDVTGALTPDFVAAYDLVWADALQHTKRAEFVLIDRPTLTAWIGRDSIASTDTLPSDLLAHIARATGAQAVVFLDVTHCAPYPPLGLGFRAKLVAVPDARIIWIADELFDTADAATASAAEHFAQRNPDSPGDPDGSVLQSPARFSSYAFKAVADLLPPRVAPATGTGAAPAAPPTR
jgi:hypothetical protein